LLSPPLLHKPADAVDHRGVLASLAELERPADQRRRRWLWYRPHRGSQATAWGRTVTSLVQVLARRRGVLLHRTPHIIAHVHPLRPDTRPQNAALILDELGGDAAEAALPSGGAADAGEEEDSLLATYAAAGVLITTRERSPH